MVGLHWHNVTASDVAPWGRIDAVEASSFDAGRAYVAIDRHVIGDPRPYVLVTDDSGATWRSIVNGLPGDQYVHVVREDPANPDVLYAGLEQGVWFSLDRGAHWQSLQLNMPSVAVHDLRVQPRQHDLIVATHGRGFWILDDAGAISGLRKAIEAAVPAIFPLRTAYTWYRWWTSAYGTHPDECCVAAGAYSGEDPAEGAPITYYLPSQAHAWIDVLGSNGRRVRCLDEAGGAGMQRTAWDLTETPPVPWRAARDWNRGGAGPTVVPGRYTVRLHVLRHAQDHAIAEQALEVRPDPRAAWTQTQYVARYEFVKSLDDELSAIDVALNQLALRLRASRVAQDDKIAAAKVQAMFTSGVVNSEDDQLMPDRLRERLTILQGVIALSQGPPLPPHYREAAAIHAQFETALGAYRAFLAAHHLPPDAKTGECR